MEGTYNELINLIIRNKKNDKHFIQLHVLPLQPGDELFPADEHNQLISDGSNFLDTWEVT